MTLWPCFPGGWIVSWWLWSCLDFWSRWSAGSDPTRTSSRYHPEPPSGLKNKTKCDISSAHFPVHLDEHSGPNMWFWHFFVPKIIYFIMDEGNSLFHTHLNSHSDNLVGIIPPKYLTTEFPICSLTGKHKVVTSRAHSAFSESTAALGPEEKKLCHFLNIYINFLGDVIIPWRLLSKMRNMISG